MSKSGFLIVICSRKCWYRVLLCVILGNWNRNKTVSNRTQIYQLTRHCKVILLNKTHTLTLKLERKDFYWWLQMRKLFSWSAHNLDIWTRTKEKIMSSNVIFSTKREVEWKEKFNISGWTGILSCEIFNSPMMRMTS